VQNSQGKQLIFSPLDLGRGLVSTRPWLVFENLVNIAYQLRGRERALSTLLNCYRLSSKTGAGWRIDSVRSKRVHWTFQCGLVMLSWIRRGKYREECMREG